ncbi:hypothetical protein [Pasteurella sp. PK-2025]|uniref:hypothetical protein n=1 Tax=Pasteurella sp. PK-2025 TaxID=3413133 RepID=UPI003C7167B3
MKIIKSVQIDGEEVELAQEDLILELNNTGRGFVTVRTDKPCEGKSAVIFVGEYDHFYKWFDGFVEREQLAENGYKKLFVREKVAIFERPLNCSHRHITLRDLCAWLTSKAGMVVKVPTADYADTPIPLFTHAGSGYQLLNNIGRQYQIKNYMWQQSPDGSLFVGSHDDSRWHGRDVRIDDSVTLSNGSNDMTLPIAPAIRPGAVINGNKIKTVQLKGDDYILTWDSLDKDGKPLQKSPERRQMEKTFPELAGGYHLPRYAKVVGVADPSGAGDISDPFRPKYAVELQLLDEHGEVDQTVPVYPAVPLPVTSTGSQGGDFAFPEVGTVVEVGFAYGRSDKPFVRTMLAQDKTIPSVEVGEQLKQQRPEVYERTDAAGNKTRETDQQIKDKSFTRVIECDQETKTIGTSEKTVDADADEMIGGNKSVSVVGNYDETTASNKSTGVGGKLQERIAGVAERVSDTKNKFTAPLSYMGTGGQNIFRILEELIQIVAEIADTASSHTHNGSPPPDQGEQFSQQNSRATAEKAKLSPIIE